MKLERFSENRILKETFYVQELSLWVACVLITHRLLYLLFSAHLSREEATVVKSKESKHSLMHILIKSSNI